MVVDGDGGVCQWCVSGVSVVCQWYVSGVQVVVMAVVAVDLSSRSTFRSLHSSPTSRRVIGLARASRGEEGSLARQQQVVVGGSGESG